MLARHMHVALAAVLVHSRDGFIAAYSSKDQGRLDRHFVACLPQHAQHKSVRLTAPARTGTIYRGIRSYPGKHTVRSFIEL